jgi:GDP-L-fucose synthase
VLPALIRKFHEAKVSGAQSVQLWGTGRARREFLFVDDLAEAVVKLMQEYSSEDIVNVGVGSDVTIMELAEMVRAQVGFEGRIDTDPSKPDGTPRKLLDVQRIHALGWHARTSLEDGLRATYADYVARLASGSARI